MALVTGPRPSPWVWQAPDYRGNVIRITIPFNTSTLALLDATVFRDPACVYTKIYLGLGPDGIPDDTPSAFPVPAGTTTLTAKQMSRQGLNTITDVVALQITAGP